MPNDPFLKIKTTPNYNKGHLVQWWLNPVFDGKAPYNFTLLAYQDPSSTEAVLTKQVGEGFYTVDDSHLRQNFDDSYTYKVRLTTADGQVFDSRSVNLTTGDLSKHKYLNASEMVRKEWVRLRFAGQFGYLLKRKIYSPASMNEVDPVTGEPIVDSSKGSYGVGHGNGYFTPVLFKYSLEKYNQSLDYHPEGKGPTYKEEIMIRTVGYPYLSPHDIMVTTEGKRYQLDDVQDIHYPGSFFTLVQDCKCHVITDTDTIYAITIPKFPTSDDP